MIRAPAPSGSNLALFQNGKSETSAAHTGGRLAPRLPVLFGHFEAGEVEARRDRAADEGEGAERFRRLPVPRGHDELRPLAPGEIGAEKARRGELAVGARADKPDADAVRA